MLDIDSDWLIDEDDTRLDPVSTRQGIYQRLTETYAADVIELADDFAAAESVVWEPMAMEVLSPQPPSTYNQRTAGAVQVADAMLAGLVAISTCPIPRPDALAIELAKRERHQLDAESLYQEPLWERFEELRRLSFGFSIIVEAFNFKPIAPKLEAVRFRVPPDLAAKQRSWYMTFRTPYLLARLLQMPSIKDKTDWSELIEKLKAAGYLNAKGKPIDSKTMPPLPGIDDYDHSGVLVPEEVMNRR